MENIDDVIKRVKEGNVVIHPPSKVALEARRKRSKARRSYKGMWDKEYHRRGVAKWRGGLKGQWHELRKAYRKTTRDGEAKGHKPIPWNLPYEDWERLWKAAGTLILPGGREVEAIKARGKRKEDVKIYRIDRDKAFSLENCIIVWQGHILANGRKLAEEKANELAKQSEA